jgi:hypothetical protein
MIDVISCLDSRRLLPRRSRDATTTARRSLGVVTSDSVCALRAGVAACNELSPHTGFLDNHLRRQCFEEHESRRRLVAIRENYHTYVAPKWVTRTVQRLLASIPEGHLSGLSSIVLTETATVAGARQSRRNRGRQPLGRYHGAWRGDLAWIELVVDQIVADLKPLDKLQVARDLAFGRVLFHEVGHHLHATRRGTGPTGEAGAESWRARLTKLHLTRCYGYLRPLAPLLRALRKVVMALSRSAKRGTR